VGAIGLLVSTLNSASLKTAQLQRSSEVLSRAKEALLGYAVYGLNGQYPGGFPAPDSFASSENPKNYDGQSDSACLDVTKTTSTPIAGLPLKANGTTMRCLGRLPWQTIGMFNRTPSENDPTGIMPWYAVSANLADGLLPVTSELLNAATNPWLTVRDANGNVLSNRVAFVLLQPNAALAGQSRPAASLNPVVNLGGANQYLDSVTVPSTCAAPCVPGTYSNADLDNDFISAPEVTGFNDQLLYVTIDDLMPLIEQRIAREAKSCLDDYALTSANKYPWAVPSSDITNFTSASNTRFGRLPTRPNVYSSNPNILTFIDSLVATQIALNNYIASNTSATRSAIRSAGNTLENNAQNLSGLSSAVKNKGDSAGNLAQDLGKNPPQATVAKVQTELAQTRAALVSDNLIDPDSSMSLSWPSSCKLFSSVYWPDWQKQVFYQIANGYQPSASPVACTSTGNTPTCLTVKGSGSYRAVVAIAGKTLGAQSRITPANQQDAAQYLDSPNPPIAPNVAFTSYKPSDTNYATVNDLVLCLDGRNTCP